jgi:4-amino-4-deoxy-L-arabinose transferase-like glycosyltransferase
MRARLAAIALIVYVLFFYGLTGTGLLGPDEPRYASIGRAMALTGDWVTPRLWGEPWFEKPALLYWLTGAAFKLGLPDGLAPRLPVALVSVAFLAFYWRVLRRHFGERAAWFSTAVLGTSAAWLAYSYVSVTDLPMTAAFAAAMLLSLDWVETGERRSLPLAAALFGVAILGKGLVPAVLAAPLAFIRPKRFPDWLRPLTLGAFVAAAAPWYVLCYIRNGEPFIHKFFLEHQFGRFASDALQHAQPFWFYIPVLLASMLPWTPLFVLLFRRSLYSDRRRIFLLLWAAFGFVFFSAATNKLPGYLLPLLPAVAALMGIALAEAKRAAMVLSSCAVMLLAIPVAAQVLPAALSVGLSRSAPPAFSWIWLVPLALSIFVFRTRSTDRSMALLAIAAAAGVLYLKITALPAIDTAVSARSLWSEVKNRRDQVCVGDIHRAWRYGLNYYSIDPLPACEAQPKPLQIVQDGAGPARPAPSTVTSPR